jgi:hypothetical protein
MPLNRKALVKVVVFQCPCGTGERQRWPRLARPRRRAILVDAPVSSMKTSRSGSSWGCSSNQACRHTHRSGLSCSVASAFFDGHGMTIKEPPNGAGRHMQAVLLQQIDQFHQRNVHLEFDGPKDHVPIGFDMGSAPGFSPSPTRRRRWPATTCWP